jgi:hypothetical protein
MLPFALAFATPRKLPKASELEGRVVVVDVAFASEASAGGFEKITKKLIDDLGPRLALWVDHHDHARHVDYTGDPRFVLAKKSEHGACPEMITEAIVARAGKVDTIVCHTDFDGLASASKWARGGIEPYPGCDDDARAIDTRIGVPSPIAVRFDRAIRARGRDYGLLGLIVRHLAGGLEDASLWPVIDEAGGELARAEDASRKIAQRYAVVDLDARTTRPRRIGRVAIVDATASHGQYDKTLLLLIGQERADAAIVRDRDTLSFAAPFDSGVDFLSIFGLSGGMPTLVSVHTNRLRETFDALGVPRDDAERIFG